MILKQNIFRSALLFGALFLITGWSFAQNDLLELLPGSDELAFDKKTGIHTLRGNVHFKYQGNIMFCDSALYYQSKNIVKAYGHVHINKQDTLNLFCDSMLYNGNTRKAKLWGHVRVRDNEYKLTTDTLEYDAKLSQASYHYGGRVEGAKSREVLTSRIGYFHPDTKNFFFSKNVTYKGPELDMTTDTLRYLYSQQTAYFFGPSNIQSQNAKMYCESGWYNIENEEGSLQKNAWITRDSTYISGDTLLYQPKIGTYIGKGNVYYRDSTENMAFTGNYAYSSDSMHYTFLTGDAIATKMMKDDTLHIHADTLYNYKLDSLEVLKAYRGAKLFSNDFQSIADSIVYDKQKERVELYHDPIVWSKESELKGTFIDIHVTDSVIQEVTIHEKASILMEVEPGEYYNQIAGNDIVASFRDNELYQAIVLGNAMTISFPEDTKNTDTTIVKERIGMNRLYSSDLRIDIDGNEIVGITYIHKPDGVFYPMTRIEKDEQFIPGFVWKEVLRPRSVNDLLDKEAVIEPENEESTEEIPEPIK